MIKLIQMKEKEYDAFMELSMEDQINGFVKSGKATAEEAASMLESQKAQFLPNGLNTANHFFYSVHDPKSDTVVGGFWYMLTENEGVKLFFVMDIQIFSEFKRKGYGTEAFEAMEEKALEMGIKTIALNVFEYNLPAREMYKNLGYEGEGDTLMKQLS